MATPYDQAVYELAEAYLEDEPHLNTEQRRIELAQLIQTLIEDYLSAEQRNYEPPDPPGFEGGFAANH